jgi:hypothetical protein
MLIWCFIWEYFTNKQYSVNFAVFSLHRSVFQLVIHRRKYAVQLWNAEGDIMDDALFSAGASPLAFLSAGSALWLQSQAKSLYIYIYIYIYSLLGYISSFFRDSPLVLLVRSFYLYLSTLKISSCWISGSLAKAKEEPLVNRNWYMNTLCSTLLPVVEPCYRK